MPEYQELLDKCHKPFKYHEHEFLQGRFIYVRIQSTVQRLNSLGVPWDFVQAPVEIAENPKKTSNGGTQWDAVTHGQLTIQGLGSRGAPGASTSTDKDNASKAAHSFALRKAASLFGISHYLMVNPDAESDFVNFMNSADLTDLTTLKKAVKKVADIADTTPAELLGKHGVLKDGYSAYDLTDVLRNEGRI